MPPTVDEVLALLEARRTAKDLANLQRFGIVAHRPFGVSMANLQAVAKKVGRSHALAESLWQTERYEARLLTAFVDEPERVTAAQMERWCREFDNWAVVDTLCFHLFDRTPHAWTKVKAWSARKPEFEKRAAFALLACVAAHDKASTEAQFVAALPLVEKGAGDERNFVKKGVSWALKAIGWRSPKLNAAASVVARRLAASEDASERWVGKDALRHLTSPAAKRRLAR
jgi:3-methyladenine DNA glycosylase AlkD